MVPTIIAANMAQKASIPNPGTHITPWWREASQMTQWAVPGIEPRMLSYNSNTLTTEPPIKLIACISQVFVLKCCHLFYIPFMF